MKISWNNVLIGVLVIVTIFLLLRQSSYFTTEEVAKARELFGKGMKDIDVAAELVKMGVKPDDALKVIADVKGSPAKIVK